MPMRRASCSCGQLVVTTTADPIRVSVCHCLACQRRTGSVFGAQLRFPRDQVEISGTSTAWTRTADSGNTLTFHFCPTCGATVHYVVSSAPQLVGVPMGAFADPGCPPPSASFFEGHQHGWVAITAEVDHHR